MRIYFFVCVFLLHFQLRMHERQEIRCLQCVRMYASTYVCVCLPVYLLGSLHLKATKVWVAKFSEYYRCHQMTSQWLVKFEQLQTFESPHCPTVRFQKNRILKAQVLAFSHSSAVSQTDESTERNSSSIYRHISADTLLFLQENMTPQLRRINCLPAWYFLEHGLHSLNGFTVIRRQSTNN